MVYVDDPALGQPQTYVNYKKVTVTVTPQTSRAHAYTQTTLIAPPSIGAISGKSTIIATVIDALTDQPVAGAPVTADLSTSPTQTRSTGADGKVVFAGLQPSAIPVNDPKYKYRLTVGLTDPWVTHPDNAPALAQQHLTASQTWTTTLKVFKKATIKVNVRDSATGLPIGERTEVVATTPGPDVLSESQTGYTGAFTFATLGGKAIQPSASDFTVAAQPDCYANGAIDRPGADRLPEPTPPRPSTSRSTRVAERLPRRHRAQHGGRQPGDRQRPGAGLRRPGQHRPARPRHRRLRVRPLLPRALGQRELRGVGRPARATAPARSWRRSTRTRPPR